VGQDTGWGKKKKKKNTGSSRTQDDGPEKVPIVNSRPKKCQVAEVVPVQAKKLVVINLQKKSPPKETNG